MAEVLEYDPAAPALVDDPYPFYAHLRDDDPVHHNERLRLWALTRYDHVVAALRDHATFSSAGSGGAMGNGRFLIFSDPPDHTKLRRLVTRGFIPSAIARLEPFVRAAADRMVGDLVAAAADGPADLVEHLAFPFPVTVIADMLGIPAERRDDFRRWSSAVLGATTLDVDYTTVGPATMEMFAFFSEVVAERRAEPGDDLISMLVTGAEPLTHDEMLMFCMLLLVAGNETTTNLIGNGTLALFAHPEIEARLRADPSLIPAAIEEMLRYDGPVQTLGRTTTRDVEIDGVVIPAGASVMPIYASANRDPRHFSDPDEFRLDRKPNDHVAFGTGIHYCLGAPLARLEARIAFETLLARTEEIRPAGPEVRTRNIIVRGLRSLPVEVTPRPHGGAN